MNENTLTWEAFEKVQMRVGTIVEAAAFPEVRKAAYKFTIDFGPEIGILKSSAQITENYSLDELIGKQIVAVVNFPKKQIGNFMSECLVLGAIQSDGKVVLLSPGHQVGNGIKIG